MAAIEGLRGIAAVGIVVLHCWITSGRPDDLLSARWWGPLRMAVPLFFVLSGYFAMGPWLRASLDGADPPAAKRLVLKRAARILPVFWLSGLAALAILAGTGSWAMPSFGQAIAYFTMLHDWVPGATGKLNPPTWTLPIELSFVLALPLIGWCILRAAGGRRARVLAVIAALWCAGLAYCVTFDRLDLPVVWVRTLMMMLPSFTAGMAAATLCYRRTLPAGLAYGLQLAGFAVFFWYLAGPLGHFQSSFAYRDLLPALCFAAVIAGAASHEPPLLGARPFAWLGSRSFGLYLWHYPVIFVLTERLHWPGQGWGTLIALSGGLVMAELTWRRVEQPVNGWARARLAG